jgi:PAS domain S-box-containing protein
MVCANPRYLCAETATGVGYCSRHPRGHSPGGRVQSGPSAIGGQWPVCGIRQMNWSSRVRTNGAGNVQILSEDGERLFCREWRLDANGNTRPVLLVLPAAEHAITASHDRLAHEYALKDELEEAWAARPLEFVREGGRPVLVLEDPGGEPLGRYLDSPMEVGRFLHIAIGIAASLGKLHRRGLVHKDIKPGNVIVIQPDLGVRLTGFGIASRLPRERQAPGPPETIAGTLAYMAPEQTGRMNRSIDSRSDLYSLGVTLYQMLTGSLPFTASDPTEWVHCHIARKPVPPDNRSENVPAALSLIVMKLLAKTAEERYQTAAGLERDLRRCLAAWEARRQIDVFPLAQQDAPDRLLIPEKLYGRAHEIETLVAAFDRVVGSGRPELVLVSGYSGIGKSSVVNELQKVVVPHRGLFASGKFEQYKRDIPYSTLVQVFQSLVGSLLGKAEAELTGWRDMLRNALEPNGRLIVDLVPELRLIIGEQPPVQELPPQDAQRRFQQVLRRFIGVFARREHPLALFLDDLQWLDAATLDLIEDLLIQSDLQSLMLIGAYRDNEVDAAHPLMRKLDAIRRAAVQVQEVRLAPLGQEDLRQLIADALRCDSEYAAPLAQLVHDKTAGNPFFVIRFLHDLAEEGLLTFDGDAAHWLWDLDRIHAKGYTDYVVDLMVAKLARLPVEAQSALQQLACLGNVADIKILSIVLGASEREIHAALWEPVRQELIERLPGAYRFVHDRVQEAAYSRIPDERRAVAHLLIGRLLVAQTPPEQREELIFEIVNQLDRGAALITSREEREELAELNLIAGRRAKASSAYASALTYLVVGASLVAEDAWERRHELAFALEINRAECEFLTGALAEAEQRLVALSTGAMSTIERAALASLLVDLYVTLDQSSAAVAVGLDYLRHLGIAWSPHPTELEVRSEYERIWSTLGDRSIEALIELPLMADPTSLATMEVLTKLAAPFEYTDANLLSLSICRMVNLSLEHGNSDRSCFAYVWLGVIAGPHFGNYKAGLRFGQLGHDLIEGGLKRSPARAYMCFGNFVLPWARHVRAGRDLVRRAFEAANKDGDITYASYCGNQLNTNLLAAGDPLADVQREAENGLAFARKARFAFGVDLITPQLGLIRTLRGLTPTFGCFDDGQFDEAGIERRFSENSDLAFAECWYWIRKLQARFLAGDKEAALDAASRAQRLLWTSPSKFEIAEYHFYAALSHAASCESGAPVARQQHVQAVIAHHRQLEIWAENCPENFENRAALVAAEIARIEGRALEAMELYEKAIRSSQANGFVQNEALAHEAAARFYAGRGFEQIARLYLGNARYGYWRWGAAGKVRQLDELYPHLREEAPALGSMSTIAASVEQLDLATVIRVSQVSSNIAIEKLIDTLMRTAVEQAGAERGVLMLPRGSEQRLAAEATTAGDSVVVNMRDESLLGTALPASIVQYVVRARESVIIDDASAQHAFSADPYIRQHQVRSILCLPLITQAKLIGVLYLENKLSPDVFTPTRISVLKLFASQAAISLENTRLYRELAEREAKIRRLVDANIIGILIFDFQGRILEANDAFLRMICYDRDDLAAGRLRWTELTPMEWSDSDARAVVELKSTGACRSFEKEYFRKDGSRVPILLAGATFEPGGNEGVAFVVDLTERKRAEAEARENERRYAEVQMQLAHANRVATMGQLTASIAHEVNQPITAALTNAQAGLRWLSAQPPDLQEVRRSFDRIVKDSSRAGNVVARIRESIKKAPPRRDRLELNGAIGEVIDLTRAEAAKDRVLVRTNLDENLPAVRGDRVQLQQVILNLIVNAFEAMRNVSEGARELLISTGRAESGDVLVSVRDSGPGLTPEVSERLFEFFHTTKQGGLGLGLSICRSIIEAHGGRLWASANAPRGAAFQFTVPVVAKDS